MILVDSNEPDEMLKLIQQSVPATVTPLNWAHMSDYFFGNYEGKRFQFSRKQAGELVANLDEAEDQLRDYYDMAEENFQIVEGIISPVRLYMKGHSVPVSDHSDAVSTRDLGAKMYCYQVQPSGFIERGHSFSTIHASILYAWLHRLAEAGIVTYFTMNWVETVRLLVTIYRNEQKPEEEHSTLQRVIKPRITIREPEPLMKALMFLSNVYKLGIGEVKAKALSTAYVNLMDIAMTSVEELASIEAIGKRDAEKLLTALGRTL